MTRVELRGKRAMPLAAAVAIGVACAGVLALSYVMTLTSPYPDVPILVLMTTVFAAFYSWVWWLSGRRPVLTVDHASITFQPGMGSILKADWSSVRSVRIAQDSGRKPSLVVHHNGPDLVIPLRRWDRSPAELVAEIRPHVPPGIPFDQ